MNFGEKLESLRIKTGLNKRQISEKLDISPDTFGKYIKKENIEGIDSIILKRIADYFNIPVDYFMSNDFDIITSCTKDDIKHIKCEGSNIDIFELISEMQYYLDNLTLTFDSKKISKDDKKYLTDSLQIGLKLLQANIKN